MWEGAVRRWGRGQWGTSVWHGTTGPSVGAPRQTDTSIHTHLQPIQRCHWPLVRVFRLWRKPVQTNTWLLDYDDWRVHWPWKYEQISSRLMFLWIRLCTSCYHCSNFNSKPPEVKHKFRSWWRRSMMNVNVVLAIRVSSRPDKLLLHHDS